MKHLYMKDIIFCQNEIIVKKYDEGISLFFKNPEAYKNFSDHLHSISDLLNRYNYDDVSIFYNVNDCLLLLNDEEEIKLYLCEEDLNYLDSNIN